MKVTHQAEVTRTIVDTPEAFVLTCTTRQARILGKLLAQVCSGDLDREFGDGVLRSLRYQGDANDGLICVEATERKVTRGTRIEDAWVCVTIPPER